MVILTLNICITHQTEERETRAYRPSYIPLNRQKNSAYAFDPNSNRKVQPFIPPAPSASGYLQEHQPIVSADEEQEDAVGLRIGRRIDDGPVKYLAEEDVFPLPNVRRRRRNENEEARLLSQSAFSRISETLGALNTVGSYLVNITRGATNNGDNRGDMQLISSSSMHLNKPNPSVNNQLLIESTEKDSTTQSVPDAILTLTKNVLGQNMTRTIEPLIKRVHTPIVMKEHIASANNQASSAEDSRIIDTQTLSEKIDLAALQEKKRKKHQAIGTKVSTPTKIASTTIAPAKYDDIDGKEGENRCTTPNGQPGRCEDLSMCPGLLLDLSGLRDSLCFKRLFIPGVCCPLDSETTVLTTQRPTFLTQRLIII